MLHQSPQRREGPLASSRKTTINSSINNRYACAAIVSETAVDLPVSLETGCHFDGRTAEQEVRNSASIRPPKAATVEDTNNNNNRAPSTSDRTAGTCTRTVSVTDHITATSVTRSNSAKRAVKGRRQQDITTATRSDKEKQEKFQRRIKGSQASPKRERTEVPKEKEKELAVAVPAGDSSVMARSVATPEDAETEPVKKGKARSVAVATCTRASLTSTFKKGDYDGKEIEVEERNKGHDHKKAKRSGRNNKLAQVLCRRTNSYLISWALLLVTFILATAFAASGLAVIATYFISKENEDSPNELVAAFNAAVASFDNTIPRKWLPSNVTAWREKVPASFSSPDTSSASSIIPPSHKKTLFLRYGTSRVNVLFSAQQQQQGQPQPQDGGANGELNKDDNGGTPIQFAAASVGASSSTSSTAISAAEMGVRTAYSAFLGEIYNPQSIVGGTSEGGPPGMDLRYSFTFNLNGVGVGVRMKSLENRDANHNNNENDNNDNGSVRSNQVTIRDQPLTIKPRVGKYVKQAVYCNNAKGGGCTLDFLRNSCGNNENYGKGTFIPATTAPPPTTTNTVPTDNTDPSKQSGTSSNTADASSAPPLPPPFSSSRLCPYNAFCGYCVVPRYLSDVCLVVVKNDHHDDDDDDDNNNNNNQPLDYYFDLGTAILTAAGDDKINNKNEEEEGTTNSSDTMVGTGEQSVDVNNWGNNASSTTEEDDDNTTSLPHTSSASIASSSSPATTTTSPPASAVAVAVLLEGGDRTNATTTSGPTSGGGGDGNGLQTALPLTSCFFPFYADGIDLPSYTFSSSEEDSAAVMTTTNESPSSSVAAGHATPFASSVTDVAAVATTNNINNKIELPAIQSSRQSFQRSGGYVYNNPTPTAPVKISILHATDPFVVLQRLTKGTSDLSLNPFSSSPQSSSDNSLAVGADPIRDDAHLQQQQQLQADGGHQQHRYKRQQEETTLIRISIVCLVLSAAFYLAALGAMLWRLRKIRCEEEEGEQQQQGKEKQYRCQHHHVTEGSASS